MMVCLIFHTTVIINRKNWRITIKLHFENPSIVFSKSERTNMLAPPPYPSLPSSANVLFEWSLTPWSRGLVRWHGKLKSYLHYHSVYGHQTWKDGKLPWWTPAYKVTWQIKTTISPLSECLWPTNMAETKLTSMSSYTKSHMSLWSHGLMSQTKLIVSLLPLPVTNKLGKMVIYLDQLLLIHLITSSCKVTWQTKVISSLPQCLWPPILAG